MRLLIPFVLSVFIFFPVQAKSEIVDWTLATVDNETVTFSQWSAAWKEVQAGLEQLKKAGLSEPTPSLVLDRLISNEVLSLEAKKKQIDVSEEDIDERVEKVRQMNNLTEEMFRRILREQGMKIETLRDQFRTQIRNEKLQQMEILPRVERPSEEALRAYYEKNKSRMMTPERRRVSHILFLQNDALPLAEQVQFKKTLEKVYQDAVSGKDFAKLASEFSQDEASAPNGGDLGWIEPGSVSPEFEQVVFSLKKGKVSELFPSRAGFHIAKVTEIRPAAPLAFEEAKNDIRDMLMQESLGGEFERWVEEQKNSYGIRVSLRDGKTFSYERGGWLDQTGRPVPETELNGLLSRELAP